MALQYCVVNLLTFATGSSYSWSSPVVPKLLGELGPHLNPLDHAITVDEKAWLVALVPFGAIFGCPLGGFLSSRLGKRKALILSGIPLLLSYLLTTFPAQISYYYVAKFLGGVGCGCCFTLVPLYVGETADKDTRGLFGCFFGIFVKMGTVFSYLVGPYVSVEVFSVACALPVAVFLAAFCLFFPETPYHLVSLGDLERAERVLTRLRRRQDVAEVKVELEEISEFVRENGGKSVVGAFSQRAALRALFIGTCLLCFQQLSGIVVVVSYMQTILEEAGSGFRADYASSVLGVVQVVLVVLTSQAIDRFGRRPLLLASTAVLCGSTCCIGAYFACKNGGWDVSGVTWVPFAAMVGYFIGYCVGVGPVVWAMMGELFDTGVKSLAASVANCLSKVVAFLTTLFFPYVSAAHGTEAAFFLLAACMLLAFVFVLLVVPETKGRSFAEIKEGLERRFLQVF